MNSSEHIFVIDSWTDTKSKEDDLIKLITRLKEYNIDIIVAAHYPVNTEIQKMVNYYIYDEDNPLLFNEEFDKYGVNSSRWTNMPGYTITNYNIFHHDYAVWTTMRNAFHFAEMLGKKYIHFMDYDCYPNVVQYRQAFLERILEFDAVVYEYNEGSIVKDTIEETTGEYCATYIFSIRTEYAIKVIDTIKTKRDYFVNKPRGWTLENQFLQILRSHTTHILRTDYITNDNEFNTRAVWNRDGIDRNGGKFQPYLAVDEDDKLYVHLISGFYGSKSNQNYLIEVSYGDYKKFIPLTKDEYRTEYIGEYKENEYVNIYYQGVEVFSEHLKHNVEKFRKLNSLVKNKVELKPETPKDIRINFVDGPFIEIIENNENLYHIQFIDSKTGIVEFELDLKSNHWARCSKKYYVKWLIKITGIDNKYQSEYLFNPENKRVLICFESRSLGDSIAWMGYVDKFRKENKCEVICSTFQNNLFRKQYSDIKFIEPGTTVNNLFALYRIGLFKDNDKKIDLTKNPTDPKKNPLLKIASDILGLDYVEICPKLPVLGKGKKKMVSIGIHATAQCKYWNNPTGWQDVVTHLNEKGYMVKLLSNEVDGYMGNKTPKGVSKLPDGKISEVIKILQESELFIGISSGLSWLSWAVKTPTIIISGFTDDNLEPKDGICRIINKDVCNGCWGKFDFDPGNWNWCPEYEGTDRQFECSKKITSETVILEIDKILFQ
jgi:autotransporter strand-loop-strand O-heptosyltransferase